GKGYANLEIEWQRLGKLWMPKCIEHRPASWFMVPQESQNELRLRDPAKPEGEPLQPLGWISHVHKAKAGYIGRAGLHRCLSWPYLFKNFSVRDLAEFLEIYGLPLRLGKYQAGASDTEKSTLLRAVMQIGHSAAGIIPHGMEIDFKEAAKGGSEPFGWMVDWCERTQSKAILGATLTAQADRGSNTNALGNVHNEVRHDIRDADAKQCARTLTRDLCYPLAALNHSIEPGRGPQLKFDTQEADDLKLFAESIPNLVDVGVQIPVSWPNEKLRIPAPKDDEAVLVRQSQGGGGPPALLKTRVAALRELLPEESVEDLSDGQAQDWEKLLGPVMQPVFELAAKAESYEQFEAMLPELLEQMNADALIRDLAQAQFVAAIWGRVSDQRR
ncbi:MAG: DUF935 domain-containing protein, partial [Nevskiales bacterium]